MPHSFFQEKEYQKKMYATANGFSRMEFQVNRIQILTPSFIILGSMGELGDISLQYFLVYKSFGFTDLYRDVYSNHLSLTPSISETIFPGTLCSDASKNARTYRGPQQDLWPISNAEYCQCCLHHQQWEIWQVRVGLGWSLNLVKLCNDVTTNTGNLSFTQSLNISINCL